MRARRKRTRNFINKDNKVYPGQIYSAAKFIQELIRNQCELSITMLHTLLGGICGRSQDPIPATVSIPTGSRHPHRLPFTRIFQLPLILNCSPAIYINHSCTTLPLLLECREFNAGALLVYFLRVTNLSSCTVDCESQWVEQGLLFSLIPNDVYAFLCSTRAGLYHIDLDLYGRGVLAKCVSNASMRPIFSVCETKGDTQLTYLSSEDFSSLLREQCKFILCRDDLLVWFWLLILLSQAFLKLLPYELRSAPKSGITFFFHACLSKNQLNNPFLLLKHERSSASRFLCSLEKVDEE